MPTRNVVLTEQHDKFIKRLVKSGRYQNASEVLREGIRLVQKQETDDAKLEALRKEIRIGITALDEGRYREFASFDDLREHLDRMADEIIGKREK